MAFRVININEITSWEKIASKLSGSTLHLMIHNKMLRLVNILPLDL